MTRGLTEVTDKQQIRRRSNFNLGSKKPSLDVIHEKLEEIENDFVSINLDKRLEIYDSHAVDYSRYAHSNKKTSQAEKTQWKTSRVKDGKQEFFDRKNNARKQQALGVKDERIQQKLLTKDDAEIGPTQTLEFKDGKITHEATHGETQQLSLNEDKSRTSLQKFMMKDCEEKLYDLKLSEIQHGREGLSSRIDGRISSLSSRRLSIDSLQFSAALMRQPTHDTLASFLKYYREQRKKDEKLKSVQSRAKLKTPKTTERKSGKPGKTSKTGKTNVGTLPQIVQLKQSRDKGNPIAKYRWKKQLPKVLANSEKKKKKRDVREVSEDTRFERLLSTLQPVYNGKPSTTLPFIGTTRHNRSYTV